MNQLSMKGAFVCAIYIILCSCKDSQVDPGFMCENLVLEFGPYELSDSARNIFPYTDGIVRLVFSDDQGAEYDFNLEHLGDSFTSMVYKDACPYDTDREIDYLINSEALLARFVNDSLGISLIFQFSASARLIDTTLLGESDILNLNIIRTGIDFSRALNFQVIHKYGISLWPTLDPLDSLMINQRVFSQVYFQPLGEILFQQWITYFNYEYGIIGIEHESGFPKLSLERIE